MRESAVVATYTVPLSNQIPSARLNAVVPGTWRRVGVRRAAGSGTRFQVTAPRGPTTASSSRPSLRSGQRLGVKR